MNFNSSGFGHTDGDDRLEVNGQEVLDTLNYNQWYFVELEQIDWNTETVGKVFVDGSLEATNVVFKESASSIDTLELRVNDWGSEPAWFDDVSVGTETDDGPDDIRLENDQIFVQINGDNLQNRNAFDIGGQVGEGDVTGPVETNPTNPYSFTQKDSAQHQSTTAFKMVTDTESDFERRELMKAISIAGVSGSGLDVLTDEAAAATLCVNPDDDTCYDTIQGAVNDARENSPGDVIEVAQAEYNEAVEIDRPLTIRGEPGDTDDPGAGSDAPIVDGSGLDDDGFFIQSGVSNVTIEGFEIQNYSAPSNTGLGHGIAANDRISDITVRHNTIHDVEETGVVILDTDGETIIDNISVGKNSIESFGAFGIRLGNATNSTVKENEIKGQDGDDTFEGGRSETGILIEAQRRFDVASEVNSHSVVVEDNTVEGSFDEGINLRADNKNAKDEPVRLEQVRVTDNNVTGPGTRGVAVDAANEETQIEDVAVENTDITGSFEENGISVFSIDGTVRNVTVRDNEIRGEAEGDGILFASLGENAASTLTNMVAEDNVILDTTTVFPGIGLYVGHSDNHADGLEVRNNELRGNVHGFGINTPDGGTYDNVVVEQNILADNGNSGVILTEPTSASGLRVKENDIFNNEQFGVQHKGNGTLDARNNWWGAENGPSGGVTDPEGNVADGDGDEVSENVDFHPWLGSPVQVQTIESSANEYKIAINNQLHTIVDTRSETHAKLYNQHGEDYSTNIINYFGYKAGDNVPDVTESDVNSKVKEQLDAGIEDIPADLAENYYRFLNEMFDNVDQSASVSTMKSTFKQYTLGQVSGQQHPLTIAGSTVQEINQDFNSRFDTKKNQAIDKLVEDNASLSQINQLKSLIDKRTQDVKDQTQQLKQQHEQHRETALDNEGVKQQTQFVRNAAIPLLGVTVFNPLPGDEVVVGSVLAVGVLGYAGYQALSGSLAIGGATSIYTGANAYLSLIPNQLYWYYSLTTAPGSSYWIVEQLREEALQQLCETIVEDESVEPACNFLTTNRLEGTVLFLFEEILTLGPIAVDRMTQEIEITDLEVNDVGFDDLVESSQSLDARESGTVTIKNPNNEPITPDFIKKGGSKSKIMNLGVFGIPQDNVGQIAFQSNIPEIQPGATETIEFDYTVPLEIIDTNQYFSDYQLRIGVQANPIALHESTETALFNASFGEEQGADSNLLAEGSILEGEEQTSNSSLSQSDEQVSYTLSYGGSDLDLHLYDSDNNHVGVDYSTGEFDTAIPDTTISGPDGGAGLEWMRVSNAEQSYTTQVIGLETDEDGVQYQITETTVPELPASIDLVPKRIARDAKPGKTVAMDVAVSEVGGFNPLEAIEIDPSPLVDESSDATIPATEINVVGDISSLQSGQTKTVQVQVSVPINIPPGTYSGTIKATAENSALNATTTLQIEVQEPSAVDEYGTIYKKDSVGISNSITTQVTSQEDMTGNAKAGLIIRNNVDEPGQAQGYVICAVTPDSGFVFQWDSDENGFLDSSESVGTTTYPAWVKLEKSGTKFNGYYSTDGSTWNKIGSAEIPSAKEIQDAGMFATSGDPDAMSRVEFEDFTIENG